MPSGLFTSWMDSSNRTTAMEGPADAVEQPVVGGPGHPAQCVALFPHHFIGVVIGVSAVIIMVTLGDGATQSVKDQITSLEATC